MSSQDVRSGSVVTESLEEVQRSGNGSGAPADVQEPPPSPTATSATGTDGHTGNGEPPAAEKAMPTEAEPRRRPRLNPTVDPSQVRAVPNISTPATSAPVTPPAETEAASPVTAPSVETTVPLPAADSASAKPQAVEATEAKPQAAEAAEAKPQAVPEKTEEVPTAAERPIVSAPVEIPTNAELDAELEAEIAAAMSADEQSAVAVAVPTEAAEDSAAEAPRDEHPEAGARIKAVVQSIHAEDVFFDLGIRAPGIVQLRQFSSGNPPEVGQEVEVVVDRVDEEEGLVYVNLPRSARKVGGDWSALTVGQTVECTVSKTNKGGLEVQVGTLRGFMPAGQVDLGFISDLEPYVGQKLQAQVVEVNPRRRNLVLSRRAVIEAERKDAEEMLWVKLEVGQSYDGTVKTIKDYGAFVDIGGVDGFLHIGEISWTRIKHPSEVLQPGQDVRVKVISLDPEKKRIGLGMRQLTNNPWLDAAEKYAKGTTVRGTVTRTTNFGAFVQLEPGVEGLVHISELDHRRVKSVAEVLKIGEEAEFQVLEVDPHRKRVGLSVKALLAKPEPEPGDAKGPGPSAEPAPQRKPRAKLKGGMGDQPAGRLFGDPRNFG